MALVAETHSSIDNAIEGNLAYLTTRRVLNGLSGDVLPLYLVEFDLKRFTLEAYATSVISCPPSIVHSVRKRQAEFLYGRIAARLALSEVMPPACATVEIGIGAFRKPLWPRGIIGSISHCDRFACAAALRSDRHRDIGIDIEPVIDPTNRKALLSTVVNTSEIVLLGAHASDEWPFDLLLTLVFSAKESFFKGAFSTVGHYFDFHVAQVVALDCSCCCIHFLLTETLCSRFVQSQICTACFTRISDNLLLTYFID